MYVLCIYICSLIMYARCIYMCSLVMMHMCMMHTSVIFNPWLCCMCVWCGWNFVTDKSTMNDACMYLQVFELCIYDACIYHLWPLTLVHVCFMCICMMHAQYIYDPGPWSWCMHVGMMRQILFRTDGLTVKAILGVGLSPEKYFWACFAAFFGPAHLHPKKTARQCQDSEQKKFWKVLRHPRHV